MSHDRPIDLKLCHDWRGKTIIPFKYYVARTPASNLNNFFWFGQLPVELQFRILQFCDASTLFNLMHTTSALRTEAEKLFWSLTNTFYRTNAAFFTIMGGSPGPNMSCREFSKNVQQLDILFAGLWDEFNEANPIAQIGIAVVPAHSLKWNRMCAADKMAAFWKNVKERFPSVKRVVLSDHYSIERLGNDKDSRTPADPKYAALVRACPPSFNLEVFVCLTNWVRFQYDDIDRLYKFAQGSKVSWELVDDDFKRNIVMQGPKQFEGPVGLFQELIFKKKLLHFQARGKRQVMMNFWIKYEFADHPDIYVCPKGTCATPFSTLKEWKHHVLTERHDIVFGNSLRNTCYKVSGKIPNDVMEDMLGIVNVSMGNAWIDLEAQFARHQKVWGDEGSSKQRQYELAFLAQLELDPEWEGSEPVKKCFIWRDLKQAMDVTERVWVEGY